MNVRLILNPKKTESEDGAQSVGCGSCKINNWWRNRISPIIFISTGITLDSWGSLLMGSSDNVCHRNATHCRQRLIVKRRSRRRRRVPQVNRRVSFQLTPLPLPLGERKASTCSCCQSTIKAGAGVLHSKRDWFHGCYCVVSLDQRNLWGNSAIGCIN